MDSVIEGESTIYLRNTFFTMGGREGVVVEEISPRETRLSFEPIVEKNAVLAARLTGSLPPALSQAGPPIVTPSTAVVRGPASMLEGIDTLPLLPLDLSAGAAAFAAPREVDTRGLGPINVYPNEAMVQMPLEATDTVVLPDLPVDLPPLEPAIPLRVIPSSVTLTLIGAESLIGGLRMQDLRVTFPLAQALNLSPGEEREVYLSVEGLHPLLERNLQLRPTRVTLRRPAGQ
jgi:hypothetical protein